MVIPLPRDQAHLYFARPSALQDPRLVDLYLGLLTPEERERHDRFRFEEHRHLFLVTRALARTTLSRYVDAAPKEWAFSQNEHGRPEIARPQSARWLRFNLSNTRDLVACLVAREREIGVDVEDLSRTPAALDIADRFFAPSEVRALKALPPDQQHRRFFEYWTLKESYIKAWGMGLAIPLSDFAFTLGGPSPLLHCEPQRNDDGTLWQLIQLWPTDEHACAISIRRGADPPLELKVRWVQPLVD